jgi:hypothetical protein
MRARKDGDAIQAPVERLTTELVIRVMGWAVAPDRFLTGQRSWMPRWRFQPTNRLDDAFRVLETARPEYYSMGSRACGTFFVEVCIGGKLGTCKHNSKPLAITLAVARALGLEEQR